MFSVAALAKNVQTPAFALSPLRASSKTLVSITYTLAASIPLHSSKVLVVANVWHGGEHLGKRASTRSAQRLLQYLAMLLFCTAIVLGSPLLECLHEIFIKIANRTCRLREPLVETELLVHAQRVRR